MCLRESFFCSGGKCEHYRNLPDGLSAVVVESFRSFREVKLMVGDDSAAFWIYGKSRGFAVGARILKGNGSTILCGAEGYLVVERYSDLKGIKVYVEEDFVGLHKVVFGVSSYKFLVADFLMESLRGKWFQGFCKLFFSANQVTSRGKCT